MSQKKENRSRQIVDLLAKEKKIEVTALSEMLHVSQVTIRKDLNDLEAQGIISREHGYAQLRSSDDIGGRLAYHYEEKRKIAAKAAELIHDGDTLMIESGSCCALLASLLATERKDLTIVTNSAFIADYIRSSTGAVVVLLGGIYQRDSQCLVGPMIRDAAAGYNVKYFFIGTDGWSARTGFTNKDQLRAQAVRDMAPSAERIVILTESEKFSAPGTVPMNVRDQPKLVITDENIPQEAENALVSGGIEVIKAGSGDPR